ncbi:hypothetical protein PENTCL1PPCAC_2478, partial [Pristionchus entomophagus]
SYLIQMPSSPVEEVHQEKTARIKTWVKNRLVELEQQNERLKEQNLRCTTQLQMLKSFTERTKQWRNEDKMMMNSSPMSRSVTGTIMRSVDARTSDDSGLTSDDQMKRNSTTIPEMTKSTVETRRISTSSTPKVPRKGVRMRQQLNDDEKDSSDTSPFEEKKMIGPPRVAPRRNTPMERDSMNSSPDHYEFDCEDEIFDEIESPSTSRHVEYVNLSDFCVIRDDGNIYSDIVKSPQTPPKPPLHAKMRLWEYQLHEAADKCLSMGDSFPPLPSTPPSHSPAMRHSSEYRRSGHSKNSTQSPFRDILSARGSYSDEGRRIDLRTSLVANQDLSDKSGFWTLSNDSRFKSLKRRFVVMRNGEILFYRNNKNRDCEPLSRLSIGDIQSVGIVKEKGSAYSFQINTESGDSTVYSTESERITGEWVTAISNAIKGTLLFSLLAGDGMILNGWSDTTMREIVSRSTPLDASISSFLTRVHCGHSKKLFASLVQHKLMFFRSCDYSIPSHYLLLSGAHISESEVFSDEQSSSSDEQLEDRGPGSKKKREYSISINIAGEDPTYLIVSSCEEKDKWMYFLRASSGDSSMKGTPFEVLLQRMLADGMPSGSVLWKDLLLTNYDENPREGMMSVEMEHEKKAIELAKAIHLFVSVLMRPTGVEYHIDLAQNILQMAIGNELIRNELYAQLIRLTQDGVPFALQGWKLLSLALPLFSPKHYALHWLLRRHLYKCTQSSIIENTSMASYCESILDRSIKLGGREEAPSRMEVNSILTRDPTSTKFPHSISIRLPTGEYQVVEFDGSTELGQCLSSLCLKLGMRPALLSGYSIYIDDPSTGQLQLLKGKQKICDALSVWEKRQRDGLRGRIPNEKSATLILRQRHYWRHLDHRRLP